MDFLRAPSNFLVQWFRNFESKDLGPRSPSPWFSRRASCKTALLGSAEALVLVSSVCYLPICFVVVYGYLFIVVYVCYFVGPGLGLFSLAPLHGEARRCPPPPQDGLLAHGSRVYSTLTFPKIRKNMF